MKILVIIAHPNLAESKVHKVWMEGLKALDNVTLHNLLDVYPDEIIDKSHEQALLKTHDRIVFQYPIYWYNMPAILRKWQDVVLEYGFAYGQDGVHLKGKDYVVAVSAGASKASYQSDGHNSYLIEDFFKSMRQIAKMTGMNYLPEFVLYSSHVRSKNEILESRDAYMKYITQSV